MRCRWTAKANTAVNLIAWMTSIAAVLIAVMWFMRNNPYVYLTAVDSLDEDVLQLSQRINNACNTISYYSEYNPVTEQGFVEFRPGELCIRKEYVGGTLRKGERKIQRCAKTLCVLDAPEHSRPWQPHEHCNRERGIRCHPANLKEACTLSSRPSF